MVDGVTAVFTEATVVDYVEGIVQLLGDAQRLEQFKEACGKESELFSIYNMADSFMLGIQTLSRTSPTRQVDPKLREPENHTPIEPVGSRGHKI